MPKSHQTLTILVKRPSGFVQTSTALQSLLCTHSLAVLLGLAHWVVLARGLLLGFRACLTKYYTAKHAMPGTIAFTILHQILISYMRELTAPGQTCRTVNAPHPVASTNRFARTRTCGQMQLPTQLATSAFCLRYQFRAIYLFIRISHERSMARRPGRVTPAHHLC